MTPPPYPPLHLVNRVCSVEDRPDPLGAYEALGAETKSALLALLPDDWSFERRRVLDFGCGAGRTLRQFLTEAQRAEFWGTDIDAASIDWASDHLCPPLHVKRNQRDPPLGFDTGSFDLIWALSVFTHLTDNSLPWLAELHRLLRPGGLLIATYMGRLNGGMFVDEPWDEDRIGMNVLRTHQSWDRGGPMVLMSDWWVREHWGRAFEIVASQPVHGQTWVLMRRREVEISLQELQALSDDPRELAALRHNVNQLERDLQRSLAELRQAYEHSMSWKLTRPLRVAGRVVRDLRESRVRA